MSQESSEQEYSNGGDEPKTNLIVNFLPPLMTDEEFRDIFENIGPLKSARIIREKGTRKSFGFGFVDFVNAADAKQAIDEINGSVFDTKTVKVSYARPSSERIKRTNCYIANLPHDITEQAVRSVFSKYGEIIHFRLLESKPGCAFIRYNHHEQAQEAIQSLNDKTVFNRKIVVRFADVSHWNTVSFV